MCCQKNEGHELDIWYMDIETQEDSKTVEEWRFILHKGKVDLWQVTYSKIDRYQIDSTNVSWMRTESDRYIK